ncbi:MAG: MBL fold metallo-hydrolase RNA specificity domain-containing protein, partial [Candidatus Micrarchaeaceae archaeon]
GFQAAGTLGREIQDGAKKVKINKSTVDIGLTIETYHLSAHADRPQLDTVVKRINGLKNIFIVHGEKTKSEEWRDDLKAKYHALLPEPLKEYDA